MPRSLPLAAGKLAAVAVILAFVGLGACISAIGSAMCVDPHFRRKPTIKS
jgi:hypothetical protein